MTLKRARKQLYEGKAKVLFEGPEPGTIIQHFKDDTTAFNNQKKEVFFGKGVLNNIISEFVMKQLGQAGIPTHFIKRLNMREQLVLAVDIIPIEVIIRNVAAGSLCQRMGLEEGQPLGSPLIEFCLKNDKLGDPLIAENHIINFNIADEDELDVMQDYALRINDILFGIFATAGIRLVDFKIEFGRIIHDDGYHNATTAIVLADEISPDSCRLWDIKSNKKMDKDIFRRSLGDLVEAYKEVAKRLGVYNENDFSENTENRFSKPKEEKK